MKIGSLFLIVLGCALLAGCGAKDEGGPAAGTTTTTTTGGSATTVDSKFVGNWTVKELPGMEVEFRNDGTMSANIGLPEGGKIFTDSTWKVEGDKITTVGTSIKVQEDDAQKKAQMEEAGKAELGKPRSGSVKWTGENEFQVTADEGGAVVTYVRV